MTQNEVRSDLEASLGHEADVVLARRHKLSRERVRQLRSERGIPRNGGVVTTPRVPTAKVCLTASEAALIDQARGPDTSRGQWIRDAAIDAAANGLVAVEGAPAAEEPATITISVRVSEAEMGSFDVATTAYNASNPGAGMKRGGWLRSAAVRAAMFTTKR